MGASTENRKGTGVNFVFRNNFNQTTLELHALTHAIRSYVLMDTLQHSVTSSATKGPGL